MSVFQDNLVKIRKEKGYTQEKLAESLNISRDKLSRWENGSRTPDLDELLKICDIFECDLDYLVGKIKYPTHILQNVCDITGLSIENVKLLQFWNNDRFYEPFTGKYIRSRIDYLNTFLNLYPELLDYIDTALISNNTEHDHNLSKETLNSQRKTLCMRVALELWNYINTNQKNTFIGIGQISQFASDFVYARLSFLEESLYNKAK